MQCRPMEGPWYTVEESLKKLGMMRSELEYAIRKNKMAGVIRLSAQPVLLFSENQGAWIGHATAKYFGHLALPAGYVLSLFNGQKFDLMEGFGQIVEAEELYQWDSNNPFEALMPIKPLTDWYPHRNGERTIENYCAAFLPTARESLMKQPIELLEMLDRNRGTDIGQNLRENQEHIAGSEWDKTKLYFDRTKILPEQLRFAASELASIMQTTTKQDDNTPLTKLGSRTQSKLASTSHLDDQNDLSSEWEKICIRLIQKHPLELSTKLWKILRVDCKQDSRNYDTEKIIVEISQERLVHRTAYQSLVEFKFSSFASKISKLKRNIDITNL